MTRRGDWPTLAVLLGVSLLWYAIFARVERQDPAHRAEERRAARLMTEAMAALATEATARGFAPDPATDPNRTGLVGLPFSPITTTLGSLPAKRTGAQPVAAELMVRLLREAGVHPGDRIAVDSSGSFPGFAIATLAATRALGAEPFVLASVGASTYGANRPDFTLPDMLHVLVRRGVLPTAAHLVSPGGASDAGHDMDAVALNAALERAHAAGAEILRPSDLPAAVAAKRRRIGTPRVLVSIGGNWTSAGNGEGLWGRTGLLLPEAFPRGEPTGTGLIQTCLRDGIPVIRILDVQDLAAGTGLPFDPIPWPPEDARFGGPASLPHRLLIGAGPIVALLAAFVIRGRRGFRASM